MDGFCCQDIAEKLLLYRDGALPEDQVQHLREHLQYCAPCLDLLNGYEEVCEVLARLKPINMPCDLIARMKIRLERSGFGSRESTDCGPAD